MNVRLRRFSQPLEGPGLHDQLNRLIYELESQFNSIPVPSTPPAPSAPVTDVIAGGAVGGGGGGGGGAGSVTPQTDHSLLLGQGTDPISSLGVAGNGQIPIGSNGADPVLATLTAGANVTITNGPGTITIASTGGGGGGATPPFTIVTTATTPYTVASGSSIYVRGSATVGANQVINLPAATGSGWIVMVKKMDANARSVVVTRAGTDTIDGGTTYTLNSQYSAIQVIDAASGVWDLIDVKP